MFRVKPAGTRQQQDVSRVIPVVVGHETHSTTFRFIRFLRSVHLKHGESIGWLNGMLWHCRGEPRLGEAEYATIMYVPLETNPSPHVVQLVQRLNVSQQDTGQGWTVCNHSQSVSHAGPFPQCFFPMQFH